MFKFNSSSLLHISNILKDKKKKFEQLILIFRKTILYMQHHMLCLYFMFSMHLRVYQAEECASFICYIFHAYTCANSLAD